MFTPGELVYVTTKLIWCVKKQDYISISKNDCLLYIEIIDIIVADKLFNVHKLYIPKTKEYVYIDTYMNVIKNFFIARI